ncbi:MAG: sensor histidine kinase [Eubacteriales bacterium]|nr:sensor histidine kinase [Eubacteriales bacterium]
MLETSTDYTSQLIDMVNNDIDSYFTNMENIAQLIMNSADARSYLRFSEDEKNTAEYLSCVRRLEQQFLTLRETRDDIYNIGIVGVNGSYLINNEETALNPYAEVEEKEWYQRALRGEEVIVYSHVQNLVEGEYPWVVTLSRAIEDPETGETLGVLLIDMNYRSIATLCENITLGSRGYVFILGDDGQIVYHPKQQLVYSGVQSEEIDRIRQSGSGSFRSQDGKRIYTVSHSEITGCTIVGVAYFSEMMEKSDRMQQLYVLIALLLIAVAAILSALISKMISEPIRALGDSMKRVEQGDFDIQIENPGYTNVIGDLIRSFNIMLERIQDLIQRIKDEQTEKRKSELSALQAQINPHFLYNTLDSIIWMAEGRQNAEVIQMTASLSRLLRKSISNEEEFVAVSDEIGYVREYLKIQKMRYHDKLDYSIEAAPEILCARMPKLILQPLVENAIYHGIKRCENGGHIWITGGIEEGKMVLRVRDDGAGMTAETMAHLFEEKKRSGHGVGVNNVNRRIKLYYGEEYGLWYESREGAGTTVDVLLPYEPLPAEDSAAER